jgi:beta-lactamase class D
MPPVTSEGRGTGNGATIPAVHVAARLPVALTAVLALGIGEAPAAARQTAECVLVGALGAVPALDDGPECRVATAPASTYKIPHALIALQAGVITPDTAMPWDGTAYDSPEWRRTHTLDSAIKWSALPFFQQTARRIGSDRMRAGLAALEFGRDGFDGDVASFWLNGDLVVTPLEQYAFLQRFFAGRLRIDAAHLAAVRDALRMPPAAVTNASGTHPFRLSWPGPVVVRIKTGNTTVAGERVSWAVGAVEAEAVTYVVVARVRASGPLDGTAGLEAARRGLDRFRTRSLRQ